MTKDEQALITRAITKISSALLNIDNINREGNPNFCGKMRRDLVKFCEFFCHHTKDTTYEMYKAHPSAWIDLVHFWFDGIDEYVVASTEEKKQISLFLAKSRSAISDLKQLDKSMSNKIFAYPIISRLEEINKKGYLKRFDVAKESLELLEKEVDYVGNQVVLN